jgi:hypothetical protein
VSRFEVYLFESTRGGKVIESQLAEIVRHERQSWNAIRTGLEMLEEFGADAGLNTFKLLGHVEGGTLWELRAQARPAYRLLFSPVPGEDAFVVLLVVRKDDMARNPQRFIAQAFDRFEHWLKEVHAND